MQMGGSAVREEGGWAELKVVLWIALSTQKVNNC
jgi:hypothetical protein